MKLIRKTKSRPAKATPTFGKCSPISITDQQAVQALLSLSQPIVPGPYIDLTSPIVHVGFPKEGRKHMQRDKRRIHSFLTSGSLVNIEWAKVKREFDNHLTRILQREVRCVFYNLDEMDSEVLELNEEKFILGGIWVCENRTLRTCERTNVPFIFR